jgi:ABC-type phosphate/phosphonate transport system substrate-binding protein
MYRFPLFLMISAMICSQTVNAKDHFHGLLFRVGFYVQSFSDVSRGDMEIAMKFWGEELGQQLDLTTQVEMYDNIDNMAADFANGKINFIVGSPLSVIKHFKLDSLSDGFRAVNDTRDFDSLVLVVRSDEGINSIKEAQGKRLVLLKGDELASVFIDNLTRKSSGSDYNRFFESIVWATNSHRMVLDLFFKKADIALVYLKAYRLACELNPQIERQTQIIGTFSSFPRSIGFFHKDVDSSFRDYILTKALFIDQFPRGRQLLTLFNSEKLERSQVSDLNKVISLYDEFKQNKSRAKQ